ncbi:MAG: hypothetical protein JXQ90_03475 [Cyclobacteriaceae bacterium]
MKLLLKLNQLFPALFLVFALSCQDAIQSEIEVEDKDMIEATNLADDYLAQSNARSGYRMAVTVLRYIDDKLMFATNTDDLRGYHEVNEETITAYVKPGEYIFWFAGGGVSDLEGIEFDNVSRTLLYEGPSETNPDRMWLIHIPEEGIGNEDGILKYDIIYEYKGNDGEYIRLDPKLKVTQVE